MTAFKSEVLCRRVSATGFFKLNLHMANKDSGNASNRIAFKIALENLVIPESLSPQYSVRVTNSDARIVPRIPRKASPKKAAKRIVQSKATAKRASRNKSAPTKKRAVKRMAQSRATIKKAAARRSSKLR